MRVLIFCKMDFDQFVCAASFHVYSLQQIEIETKQTNECDTSKCDED